MSSRGAIGAQWRKGGTAHNPSQERSGRPRVAWGSGRLCRRATL